jgi:hypothetical protein
MQQDDEVYVGHMLDLVGKVVAKTERITREEFDRDENLRLALGAPPADHRRGRAARLANSRRSIPRFPGQRSSGCATRSCTTTWESMRTYSGGTVREEVPRLGALLEKLAVG